MHQTWRWRPRFSSRDRLSGARTGSSTRAQTSPTSCTPGRERRKAPKSSRPSKTGIGVPTERLWRDRRGTRLMPISHRSSGAPSCRTRGDRQRCRPVGAISSSTAIQSAGSCRSRARKWGVERQWAVPSNALRRPRRRLPLVSRRSPTRPATVTAGRRTRALRLPPRPIHYTHARWRFLTALLTSPPSTPARRLQDRSRGRHPEDPRALLALTSHLMDAALGAGFEVRTPATAPPGRHRLLWHPEGGTAVKELIARDIMCELPPQRGIRSLPHFYTRRRSAIMRSGAGGAGGGVKLSSMARTMDQLIDEALLLPKGSAPRWPRGSSKASTGQDEK